MSVTEGQEDVRQSAVRAYENRKRHIVGMYCTEHTR